MLSLNSFAKITDKTLAKEYGRDLTNAPFFLRFAYEKEFNKDWDKTDYAEREAYLMNYETDFAAEQAKERADAKAEALKEKELLLEKKWAARREKDRLKAEADKEKAEKLEDEQRQKQFDDDIKAQQKELDDMEKLATHGE